MAIAPSFVAVAAGARTMAIAPSFVAVAAGGGNNGFAPSLPSFGRLRARRFSDSSVVAATISVMVGAGAIAVAPFFVSVAAGGGANGFEPSMGAGDNGINGIEPLLPFCGRRNGRRCSKSFIVAAPVSVAVGLVLSSVFVAAGASKNGTDPLLQFPGRLRWRQFIAFVAASVHSAVVDGAMAPLFLSSLAPLLLGGGGRIRLVPAGRWRCAMHHRALSSLQHCCC